MTALHGLGMGGHERPIEGETNDWLTPMHIIEDLGPFDLDPSANSTWTTRCAAAGYTIEDDGLSKEWFGRVWLNPPYGPHAGPFLERLAQHGDGIALIFARTETESFFRHVWSRADALLFLKGRLKFLRPDLTEGTTNAGAPSVLVAYGRRNETALATSGLEGRFVRLRQAW